MKNLKSLFLRSLYKAVGKLRATSPAISLAPLQIRGLQQCLIQSLRKGKTYETQVTLDSEAVKELKWWIINLQIIQGKPISLIPPEAQVRIATDASKTAWGAHRDGGETIGDQWSPSERTQHINVLELVAVELALKTFFREQTPVSVHLQIDNTTALSYLVKMGGTRSITLNMITKRIWKFLSSKSITLTASWIPSDQNVIPDKRSRLRPNSSELLLSEKVFLKIVKKFGTPSVDLFASRSMHKIDNYMSLSPDPECSAVDAMSQSWEGTFPFMFPPFCLIGRVLKKLKRHQVEKAILVAPMWAGQTWFPVLLEQCIRNPYILPNKTNLLTGPDGKHHPIQKRLHLAVFLVTGKPSRAEGYRQGLQNLSLMQEGKVHQLLTNPPGKSGAAGAVKGVLIPIAHL